jgi:hypothetical protein
MVHDTAGTKEVARDGGETPADLITSSTNGSLRQSEPHHHLLLDLPLSGTISSMVRTDYEY